jgi:hypothetical protein
MRALTSIEQTRLKLLTKYQISLALIEPTETGLKKSIMDATGSVRSFLKENDIHSYEHQRQGPENKILIRAKIYDSKNCYDSVASLYRPNTKNGDPRIWFKNLNTIASSNDIIAITFFDDSFHVFNLSKLDISEIIDLNLRTPFNELIEEISGKVNEVAFELLSKLKSIARQGLVPSMVAADTSVGRTLEKALGIEINSSKEPDYKGIELKSFRDSKVNRKNLFAQVPDWSLSKFKSSSEILEEFGYHRGEDFKLYCTVSAIVRNSQGLILKIDSEVKQLKENSNKPELGDFVVWTLETLHKRLLEKHRETFWVKANSTYIDGREYFQYISVEHTKKPIVSQFDILIEQGIITMDHLIKKNAQGKVVEKGPLFKIQPKGIDLLFPSSEKYSLTE